MMPDAVTDTTILNHPAAPPAPLATATTTPSNQPVAVTVNMPAAPAAPVAPAAPQTVPVSLEQIQNWTSMSARLAQLEADQRTKDEAAKAALVAAMAAKGDIENALRTVREDSATALKAERDKLAAIEERARRHALDSQLSQALASHRLVEGGAEQLTKLFRSEFVVDQEGESYKARTPTYEPIGAFIAAQLGRPEFAHFVQAKNPAGGIAGTGGQGTTPTPIAETATPVAAPIVNMGDAILRQASTMKAVLGNGQAQLGVVVAADGSIVRQRAESFGLKPIRTA